MSDLISLLFDKLNIKGPAAIALVFLVVAVCCAALVAWFVSWILVARIQASGGHTSQLTIAGITFVVGVLYSLSKLFRD